MKRCSVIPVVFVCMLIPAVGGAQNSSSSIHRDLHYTISMGGKPVGTSEISVEPEHDGRATLRSRTRIDLKSPLFSYHYTSAVRETWSGERLISAEAETIDDAKTSHTQVTRVADTVVVVTDKGERRLTGNVATTSFWNLPRMPNATLTFIDVETGVDFQARARFVKETEFAINGSAMPCRLWQLAGDIKTQLCFDRDDVLVRMEYEEQGQRFVYELITTTTLKEKP